eukprot:CAMPEP_0180051508 /NCGR_PEP_ID=MMETSP0985-20121206/1209_1 /TAXON_ID=483367 /ORGANISM="non described non described, Strain CCMP 2436" /LENGTH=49 /DNA_ID= /DNA_START= /DNA_END= /DNA_ORIENTATION=
MAQLGGTACVVRVCNENDGGKEERAEANGEYAEQTRASTKGSRLIAHVN